MADERGRGIGSDCVGVHTWISNDARRVADSAYMTEAESEALKLRNDREKLGLRIEQAPGHSNTNQQRTADQVITGLCNPRRKRKEILITIEDGVITSVLGVPKDYILRVEDFDSDGGDPEQMQQDAEGDMFYHSVFTSDGFDRTLADACFGENRLADFD